MSVVIQMSEKRIKRFNLDEGRIWEAIEGLSPYKTTYSLEEVCEKLNELYDENEQLRQTIKEMQNDERLYANEIVKLNKEAKEVLNFKTLGGDY